MKSKLNTINFVLCSAIIVAFLAVHASQVAAGHPVGSNPDQGVLDVIQAVTLAH